MSHMGCSSKPEALVKQAIRAGLSDGWGGSMMGTEFSDVLFGTPKPIETKQTWALWLRIMSISLFMDMIRVFQR